MEIHFVSSLTVDDEGRVAAVVLSVATCLLDQFAVAYSVRIETSDGEVFQRIHPALTLGALAADAVAAPHPTNAPGSPEQNPKMPQRGPR